MKTKKVLSDSEKEKQEADKAENKRILKKYFGLNAPYMLSDEERKEMGITMEKHEHNYVEKMEVADLINGGFAMLCVCECGCRKTFPINVETIVTSRKEVSNETAK